MPGFLDELMVVTPQQRNALTWFWNHRGRDVSWSEIRLGTGFPITTQKGIYKPRASSYALSIRRAMGTDYEDRDIEVAADGTTSFQYFQEGHDPAKTDEYFTNRSLKSCRTDGVPVGVIVQIRKKPARYRIDGLAQVDGFDDGFFRFQLLSEVSASAIGQQPLTGVPVSTEDARRRINAAIVARQGAGQFRAQALAAYGRCCAITDCDVEDALEAAHILPYRGQQTNVLTNTLLLRADLHTLLDRGLLSIDPENMRVVLAPALKTTAYAELAGTTARVPSGVDQAAFRANLLAARALLAARPAA